MDVTAKSEFVQAVGKLLDEHKGAETLVLDVQENCSWTEYFVITTASSQGHLRGLVRHLQEFLDENEVEITRRAKKMNDEGWILIDCQFFVVHVMSKDFREFYDLEKLWFNSKPLFEGEDE